MYDPGRDRSFMVAALWLASLRDARNVALDSGGVARKLAQPPATSFHASGMKEDERLRYAKISRTTSPYTSVRRKSRPE